MKRLLLSLMVGVSFNAAASSMVELVSRPNSPDRLFHDGSSFMVQRMGVTHEVPSYAVERDIRSHDIATLLTLQQHGYFDVLRTVNGEVHRVEFMPVLKGGGPVGAAIGVAIGGAITGIGAWLGCKALKKGVEVTTGSKEAGEAAVVVLSTVAGTTGTGKAISLKILAGCGLFFAVAIPF